MLHFGAVEPYLPCPGEGHMQWSGGQVNRSKKIRSVLILSGVLFAALMVIDLGFVGAVHPLLFKGGQQTKIKFDSEKVEARSIVWRRWH
jgi:hypothetical protein